MAIFDKHLCAVISSKQLSIAKQWGRSTTTDLADVGKEFSADLVVSFDVDFSQDALTDRVVFGVELVEPADKKRRFYRI